MTIPADLPASLVPGLTVSTQSDEQRYLHAAIPVVPDAALMNDRLSQLTAADVSRYRTDLAQSEDAGSTGAGELNLNWQLVGASAEAIGVLLTGQRTVGPSRAGIHHVQWWDPASGRLLNPPDLFSAGGWSELSSRLTTDLCASDASQAPLVAKALSAQAQGSSDFPAPAELGVAFARDGSAVLTVSSSTATAQPMSIVLPAAQVQPWLSPAGRAAAAAATRPQSVPLAAPQVPGPPAPPKAEPKVAPARKTPAKNSTAKKTPAKKSPAKKTPAKKSPAKKTPAKKTRAKQTPAWHPGPVNCRRVRCVALTFDDGPGPYTADLVAKLRAAHAPATFFMMGEHVDAFPSLARQVSQAGFEIGNHSYTHPDLTRLKAAEINAQLSRTSDAIQRATGHRPTLVRPPYGARNAGVDHAASQAGLAEVLWDVDTLDWKHRNVKVVQQTARRETRQGSIVLLHDIHRTTVQAVPGLVSDLRRRGYTLVTVSNLLGATAPGSRHFRAG